jgi:hypothetical protein
MSSSGAMLNSPIANALYYDQIGRISQSDTTNRNKWGVNGSFKGSNGWPLAGVGSV